MARESSGRVVLGNIHNLVTWHHGQNYLFNGCMQYLMECLHEDRVYDYWFFSGVTGDSFTQVHRIGGNDPAAVCLSHDTFGRELAKKAFDACGYGYTLVARAEFEAQRDHWIRRITEYIDEGIPVITQGFEGTEQFAAICGYQDDGDSLLALVGDDTAPTESRHALDHSRNLVFVGGKIQAPPLADVFRSAVMSIHLLVSAEPRDGLLFGKAAFDAWADGLLQDGTFVGKDDAEMDAVRWRTHCGPLCIAGTNGCSRGFLKEALSLCPDMAVIPRLQPIYERMQSIFEGISSMQGGFFIPFDRLRDPDTRRSVSARIHEFNECCDRVLETTGE